MSRVVLSAIVIFLCAVATAWAAPTRDTSSILREAQRDSDQKQLWLAPDSAREFVGDFIARLRREATKGNVKAQATLGLCHQLGLGVKRDLAKAAELYRKAAAAGHAGAQNNLGLLYDEGAGVPRDPAKALELYRAAATSDYPVAQFNIGLDYATGTAVPQSWTEAAVWYRKAAAQGELRASNNLGNIYLLGRGVPVDLAMARKYLLPPADAGLAVSQFGMGAVAAAEGTFDEAAARFRASAEGGYPGGQFFWAVSLFEAKGVPADPKEALKWARLAAKKLPAVLPEKTKEADALIANILLSELPGIPPNPEEAHEHARRSAEQGDPRGQHLLGVCYHRGAGVERDLEQAIKWYRLGAGQQDPNAALNLGMLLESGNGVKRDFAEAAKRYAVAAEAGNVLAQYRLGLMFRDGLGVESDLDKAAELMRRAVAQSSDPKVREELAQIEKQLAAQPVEMEFRRGLELAQQAERGADTFGEAFVHLRKAADAGHRHAIAITAAMLRHGRGAAPDEAMADAMIAKLGRTSDPTVLHLMGVGYIFNEKIAPKHVKQAMGYLRRAAQQGYAPSQNTLGFRLMMGDEGKPDLVEAFMWLTLAARQGDANAKANLDRLRPTLNEAQIEEATRRADTFQPRRE